MQKHIIKYLRSYHLNKGDDAATSEQVKGYLDYLSDNKKKD